MMRANVTLLPDDVRPSGWSALVAEGSVVGLCSSWLEQLRDEVPQTGRCLCLFRLDREELQLAAVRPSGVNVDDLAVLLGQAARSLASGCFDIPGGVLATAPVVWEGEVRGLVAIELFDSARAPAVLQALHWGCGWLVGLAAKLSQRSDTAALIEAKRVMRLTAAVLAESDFDSVALALANRIASTWQADGVMIGWVDQQSTRVVARSNASQNDERANVLNLASAAMDEALDLRSTVQFNVAPASELPAINLPAHRAFAAEARADTVATALLFDQGVAVGAVLLDRRLPFTPEELETLDTQCMMLAPLLALRHVADRSLWQHVKASVRYALRRLGDDSSLGWKAVAGCLALAVVAAALVPMSFRVTAPSVVEGEVQRVIAAPFQGFVREARFRAGDVVRDGEIIATLDDKDLRLELARWQADLAVALHKEREAMAAANRVDMRLAAAQANQARAQLGLAEEKLKRVDLTAPFAGVIVRGDLSQQLGSPVEQGKILFEIAPLDAWRVILKIDERDIAYLQPGQQGDLVLAGLSGVRESFVVKRVTAVATAEEGRNHFRVEAEMKQHDVKLRPGMEGIAKVEVGSASALWVATRRLGDWLRLTVWEWSP